MTTNKFTESFAPSVREGDAITGEKDGFVVRARIIRDEVTGAPDENDDGFWPSRDEGAAGYVSPERYAEEMKRAEKVMAAWRNDEWFYCGVVLSVSVPVKDDSGLADEVELFSDAASLWGVEANYPGSDNSYLTEVANELFDKALAQGKDVARQIAAHVGGEG